MSEINLAPGFLLSMPQLEDPNFERAVVLMVDHDDNGSFGLIVNRSTDLTVSSLLSALELEWKGPGSDKVWSGGPVMPTSGWALHAPCADIVPSSASLQEALATTGAYALRDDLVLSTSVENLRALAEAPVTQIRFVLGYAGWGSGQLATEMSRGSWLHADLNLDVLFETPAQDMWKRALGTLGIDPEAIVQTRGVH